MSRNCVVLIGIFLVLVTVDCATHDLKVNGSVSSGSDPNVGGKLGLVKNEGGSKVVETEKLDDNKDSRVNGSQDSVSKSNGDEQLGSKDGSSVLNSGIEANPETKSKDGDAKKEKLGENVDATKEKSGGNVDKKGLAKDATETKDGSRGGGDVVAKEKSGGNVDKKGLAKDATGTKDGLRGDVVAKEKSGGNVDQKELKNVEDHTGEATGTKGGFRREECDQSTMCEDSDKKFVACLQVPGNESPDIFLLIKNKGKGPRTITISVPIFVHLEKTEVQIPEKEDQKVKVSIGEEGTSHVIVLKEGNSSCSLDFKDLIMHNSGQDSAKESTKPYMNFPSRKRSTAIVFFAAVVMVASGWMCFSFRKKHLVSRSKYQRMDMELPISTPVKADSDGNDGWDDNWGDSWDDEEAPHTPSMPLTPSLSSKGLASRRLNKEAWKD